MAYVSKYSGTAIDSILTSSEEFAVEHLNGRTVTNIPDPQISLDVVNKQYLESQVLNTLNNINAQLNNINTTLADLESRIEEIEGKFNTEDAVAQFLNGMATKKLPDGSNWARIFYHNVNSGKQVFSSLDEAINCDTTYKKSQLYRIDDFKNNAGKFELMLCYPDYSSGYNRWKQTSNPINVAEGSVTGKEAISTSFSSSWSGGIGKSNEGSCYFDGCTGTSWWYAIASTASYSGGIPGPHNVIITSITELWVRYDDAISRL